MWDFIILGLYGSLAKAENHAAEDVRKIDVLLKTDVEIAHLVQGQNDDIYGVLSPKQLKRKLEEEQAILTETRSIEADQVFYIHF